MATARTKQFIQIFSLVLTKLQLGKIKQQLSLKFWSNISLIFNLIVIFNNLFAEGEVNIVD